MQAAVERLEALGTRPDIGFNEADKGTEPGFILRGANRLNIDSAARFGAISNPITLAELQLLAYSAWNRRLITVS